MIATALISLRQSIVCQINQNISTARAVVPAIDELLAERWDDAEETR